MLKNNIYKLFTLEGTIEFVRKELLEKYPSVNIVGEDSSSILFESDILDINVFRNLYSPTFIEKEKERINLSHRDWRKEYVPAGINPSLAYIMCMIAELEEKDIVCDPFCGTSVIPITALKYFNVKRVICSDVSGGAIEKSKINFKFSHLPDDKYKLLRSDVKEPKFKKQNIDKIITNLPFGIRVGSHEENKSTYEGLELLARKILRKKGRLIVLTQEKVLLREVFKKESWNVKSIIRVNEGGLLPEVFEIKRLYP
ncbi:MAG: TRM11 family methyltransferase [Candidatus Dojkabacteria bacterium]